MRDAAAQANFAEAFSATAAYAAGQIVTYTDGKLYRFTAYHSPGAWTGTDAEAVDVGGETFSILNTIAPSADTASIPFVVEGLGSVSYSDGTILSSSVYAYTNYIDVGAYSAINFKRVNTSLSASNTKFGVAFYDADKNYMYGQTAVSGASALGYSDAMLAVPSSCKFLRATIIANAATAGEFSISGDTRIADVIRRGENLWGYGDVSITSAGGTYFVFLDTPIPAGTYRIRANVIGTYGGNTTIQFSNTHTTAINSSSIITNVAMPVNEKTEATFTLSSPAYSIRFLAGPDLSTSGGYRATFQDMQILENTNTADTDYNVSAIDETVLRNLYGEDITDFSQQFVSGGFINTGSATADINSVTSSENYVHLVVPCTAGEQFVVVAFGQTSPRTWAFVDAAGNVLARSNALSGTQNNVALQPAELKAPAGAAHLVVNHYIYGMLGYNPQVFKMSANPAANAVAVATHKVPSKVSPAWKTKVVAAYDKYLVTYDNGILRKSADCGHTWTGGVDISALGIIKSYHMYATGTLAFFTHTQAYYTDDCVTYHTARCYEANGTTTYTPAELENFYTIFDVAERKFIGSQDMYVFGNYVVNGANTTPPTRVLLWYSVDNGRTYRIAYEFNLADTYAARHCHAVVYYKPEDVFIVCTGDSNATECRVLAFTYDTTTGTWSNSVLGGSSREYKWAYISIWGDELYFSYDNTPGTIAKCKYADIGDLTKHEVVLSGTTCDAIVPMIGQRGDMIVTQSHSRSDGSGTHVYPLSTNFDCRKVYYSSNRKDWAEIFIDPQIQDSYSGFSGFLPLTADGHFICGVHGGGGTTNWDKTPSVYLDDYVRLAGYNDAFKPL